VWNICKQIVVLLVAQRYGKGRGREPDVATTQELVQQLRDYAQYRYTRACTDIMGLSDEQLTEAVGDARTWEQAWRKTRAYCKTGTTAPPPKVAKMGTAEYRKRMRSLKDVPRGSTGKLVCWEAAVDAFGVTARTGKPEYTGPILGHLRDAGWGLEEIKDLAPVGVTPTLATFLAAHTDGDYMVFMNGHVISSRNGVITDTTGSGQTVKRRVTQAFRVIKPRPPVTCVCAEDLDLTVFGHGPRCPVTPFATSLGLAATA
jgi:hypothetical protein